MRIGLLAYHFVCNFGATLQLLSTYMYLQSRGHTPIIINWIPQDLEHYYDYSVPAAQQANQATVRKQVWTETPLCRTSADVAKVIEQENIKAVVIGSDAVAQHHPLVDRMVFPCKKIVSIGKNTSDREFPNAFWAVWLDLLKEPIPVAVMSVSCQDSSFKWISPRIKKNMMHQIERYAYLSVRDKWTQDMFSHISHGQLIPAITPDPVFAFNQNASSITPSREETLRKFNLPERYVLLSFLDKKHPSVTQQWIDDLGQLFKKAGKTCVLLPFSHGDSFGLLPNKIQLPLSPIDWYALIKYSDAYIGNNMHPIVVSIHNHVPFFSFDTYGRRHLNGLITSDSSSKIKNLLEKAKLDEYRVSSLGRAPFMPTAKNIYAIIESFDTSVASAFAHQFLSEYNMMMETIMNSLKP